MKFFNQLLVSIELDKTVHVQRGINAKTDCSLLNTYMSSFIYCTQWMQTFLPMYHNHWTNMWHNL